MKYLMSRHLLDEDAKKFMREHEGHEFVDEIQLYAYVQETLGVVCRKLYLATGVSMDKEALRGSVAKGIIDDIDAIVCYPDDAEKYGRFGKKIITVERSDE